MRTVNTVKRKTRSERACPQSDPGAAPRPQGVQKSCFTFILRIRALPKIQHITNLQKTNPEHEEAATGIMGNGPSSAEEHPQN